MKRAAALLLATTLGAVTVAGIPLSAPAKDLGVRGATWPVAEPDLLAQIEARLLEMQRSGELERLETQARANARRKLEEPDPAPGIAPARKRRSRLWDPAITVARNIRTADGAPIAAAGTRVNPLERVTLARDLLFVDGRREAEIAWALARQEAGGRSSKIVLLAGRPLDLMRRHARPFFFDQGGRLAARFGLRFTPSLVEQAGSQLRITEIPVESLPPRLGGRDRLPGSGDRDPGSLSGQPRTPIRGAGPNEADEED